MRWMMLWMAGVGVAGCSGPSTMLAGFDPPPPPANAFQIVLPIVRGLAPGSDNELCTWTDHIDSQDVDVRALEAIQSRTGHHIVLYSTVKMQPPGTTRRCTDDDMVTFRYVGAAGAGEGMGTKNEAPGNLVFRIPAGSQLVVNHHYLNATPETVDAQSAVTVYLADPGASYVRSGALMFVDTDMMLPAGHAALDIACTLKQDQKAWFLFPHMHEWGTLINVDQVSGGVSTRLFGVDWAPDYVFHPPKIVRDPGDPFILKAGDQLRVHCEWDTPQPMAFGAEMCLAFAQTVDDTNLGNLACNHGDWASF